MWGVEPIDEGRRNVSARHYTAYWIVVAFGFPAVVIGAMIVAPLPKGGLGLSFAQFVLVALLGVVIVGVLLAGLVNVAAASGVPTPVLFRPALGVWGGGLMVLVNLVALTALGALGLRSAGDVLDRIFSEVFGARLGIGAVFVVGVAALALVLLGPLAMARWWAGRFAAWAALGLTVVVLWVLVANADMAGLLAEPRGSGFWVGVDLVVVLGMLWMPTVADTARLAPTDGSAASAAGTGFTVGTLPALGLGALLALGPGLTDVSPGGIVAGLFGATGALLAGLALLVLLVVGEFDQPFPLLYSAGMAGAVVTRGRLGRWLPALAVVAATAWAVGMRSADLLDWVLLGASLFGPLFGVLFSDHIVVRRRDYNVDAMYSGKGQYGRLNPTGIAAVLVGFAATHWIEPRGPAGWTEWIRATWPVVVSDPDGVGMLPVFLIGGLSAFVFYAIVGSLLVKRDAGRVTPMRI